MAENTPLQIGRRHVIPAPMTAYKLDPDENDVTIPQQRFDQTIVGRTTLLGITGRVVHRDAQVLHVDFTPAEKPTPPPIDHWEPFKRIGLGPKQRIAGRAQKLVVSTYRVLGFGVLTLIVAVLVSYIVSTTFYLVSTSWVMPVQVSPSDERVVALRSQLAEQQNVRDKLAVELADVDRAIDAQRRFQTEFEQAIRTDLAGREDALRRVRDLATTAAKTGKQIRAANAAFAADHARKIEAELDAGLISRSTMLGGKQQLAQISSTDLAVAERQAELEQRADALAIEARALDALLADQRTAAIPYDVLKIKRDYDASKLELQKATEHRTQIAASIARQDEILRGLQQSSYLRALADHATVALVPYDNLGGVERGTPLYACRVGMVWCRDVGSVVEVLPGEVSFKHPRRDVTVRGQMIEVKFTEGAAAERDVVFVGGAPLAL
jgi:hypothetical protein